jgi:hypothetical protein
VEAVEYKGIEYQVVQTANPSGWKWTALLDATRTRTGTAPSRAHAVLDAERAIDKVAKDFNKAQ